MNFEKYSVAEFADVLTGFPFKSEKYSEQGLRVVRGENVTIGELRWDTIKCWNDYFREAEKYSLVSGDVVIGMDGSRVGQNRAQIKEEDLPLLLAQRVARLRAKKSYSQDFLAHVIKSDSFESYVNTIKTGTSIPHISAQQIKEFSFYAPDLPTQQRIAAILSAFDDKIALNRQMNQTLEDMARAVFREWFVNFNYPGADGILEDGLPEGWRMGTLGEIYRTTSGGTPSRDKPEYYEGGTIKWIKSKELNNTFIINVEESISSLGFLKSSAKILPPGTVLMAMYGATVGEIGIVNFEATCNQAICAFLPNIDYPYSFLYQFLKQNRDEVILRAVGSAQQNVSQQTLLNFPMLIPPTALVKQYHDIVKHFLNKIEGNMIESQTLATLRDGLLPKLMKAEIDL